MADTLREEIFREVDGADLQAQLRDWGIKEG